MRNLRAARASQGHYRREELRLSCNLSEQFHKAWICQNNPPDFSEISQCLC
jgi:hypothetical protein